MVHAEWTHSKAKMSDTIFQKIDAYLKKITAEGKPQKLTGSYKFVITKGGATYKTWVLDLTKRVLTQGDGSANVTLQVEDDVMLALGSKKMTATDALSQDKVVILEGQAELVLALEPFIAEL